jgi:hypothetical protein
MTPTATVVPCPASTKTVRKCASILVVSNKYAVYACAGCFWEKMTLCAFNQANGTAVKVQCLYNISHTTKGQLQVQFLDCMDSRGGASMPTAPAEACSSQLGLVSQFEYASCES